MADVPVLVLQQAQEERLVLLAVAPLERLDEFFRGRIVDVGFDEPQ